MVVSDSVGWFQSVSCTHRAVHLRAEVLVDWGPAHLSHEVTVYGANIPHTWRLPETQSPYSAVNEYKIKSTPRKSSYNLRFTRNLVDTHVFFMILSVCGAGTADFGRLRAASWSRKINRT